MKANDLSKIALENSVSTKLLGFEDTLNDFCVTYIIDKAVEKAKQGYGSCILIFNRNIDISYIKLNYNHFGYSLVSVKKILINKGFKLKQQPNYEYGINYKLIWNKNLLQSPLAIGV